MVDGIALRLQEENRELRRLIREMQAILEDPTLPGDDRIRAAMARADALGLTS